jgi:hypothetical protein
VTIAIYLPQRAGLFMGVCLSCLQVRVLFAIVVGTATLVAAGVGTSAPTAVEARACKQHGSFFNVHLLGEKDSADWVAFNGAALSGVPKRKAVAVVWSLGGPASTSGIAVYGWTTAARTRFALDCTSTRPGRQRPLKGLRAPVRLKNGWHDGSRFACLQPGRLVVDVRDIRGGKRLTVRMQRTGELIAVAELTGGGGWIRGSRRCDDR